jgi:hypothetical protein
VVGTANRNGSSTFRGRGDHKSGQSLNLSNEELETIATARHLKLKSSVRDQRSWTPHSTERIVKLKRLWCCQMQP